VIGQIGRQFANLKLGLLIGAAAEAIDFDVSFGRRHNTGDNIQERAFAHAVCAHQRNELPRWYLQIDMA
jgi:hypothetical protein